VLGCALGLAACGEGAASPAPAAELPFPPDSPVNLALEFDGLDDYATMGCAKFPAAESPLALSLRFRWHGGSGMQSMLVLRKDMESGFRLAIADGVPTASRVWGGNVLGTAPAVGAGEWHHLAYVSSGGEQATHTLYLDGEEVSRTSLEPTNRTPTSAWLGTLDGKSELFGGALDDVRVWTTARTAEEIAAEAAGEVPDQHPALTAYWSFDESSGPRAADRSGYGNHAVLGDGIVSYAPTRQPR
jgi:hypothetical protein